MSPRTETRITATPPCGFWILLQNLHGIVSFFLQNVGIGRFLGQKKRGSSSLPGSKLGRFAADLASWARCSALSSAFFRSSGSVWINRANDNVAASTSPTSLSPTAETGLFIGSVVAGTGPLWSVAAPAAAARAAALASLLFLLTCRSSIPRVYDSVAPTQAPARTRTLIHRWASTGALAPCRRQRTGRPRSPNNDWRLPR